MHEMVTGRGQDNRAASSRAASAREWKALGPIMIDRTASSSGPQIASLDRSLFRDDQPGPAERVGQPALLAVLDAEQTER